MSSDTPAAVESQASPAGATGIVNGASNGTTGDALNGTANGHINGHTNGTSSASAAASIDPSALPQAPPIPPTPSPPPTARTAKRQSHVVSFDKTLENIIKLETHDLDIQDNELVVVGMDTQATNYGIQAC